MDENILSEVFDDVYRQEFSEFDNTPRHFFSLRHRKAVKGMLYPQAETYTASRRIPIKKRLLIALLVILLSAIGLAAGAAVSRSFLFKERNEFTFMTAAVDQNAPSMFDNYYYLPDVPQGSELYNQQRGLTNAYSAYKDGFGRFFFIGQTAKDCFEVIYETDGWFIEEIKVNERPAVYFTEDGLNGTVIWDNEDCILEVGGELSKDELIALAESVELEP